MKKLKIKLMKKLGVAALLAASLLQAQPAQAWWDTGHMITAQIALNHLKPEVRQEAERLIGILDAMEPVEYKRHFVPASVWMDDTKARGLRAFNRWHYINIPYNAEALAEVPDAPDENIIVALESMAKTLANKRASDFEKAFALRVLLHLVGDIHQPFHAVGRISEKYPDGDWGGNRTPVAGIPGIRNIHAFWDSTGGRFDNDLKQNWSAKIPGFAAEVESAYPPMRFASDSLVFAPQAWAKESYHIAVKDGYLPMLPGGKLDQNYIHNAQEICERRLALGGYRLAAFLNATLHAPKP